MKYVARMHTISCPPGAAVVYADTEIQVDTPTKHNVLEAAFAASVAPMPVPAIGASIVRYVEAYAVANPTAKPKCLFTNRQQVRG